MGDPGRGGGMGVQHLRDEAHLLRERLHRVAVALALTEERLADVLEELAGTEGSHAADHRLHARRARAAAGELRAFQARLQLIYDRR